MRGIKYAVVWALEHTCGWLDKLPRIEHNDDNDEGRKRWRAYRHGCYGCYPLRLATLSGRLDDRWETGYWGGPR